MAKMATSKIQDNTVVEILRRKRKEIDLQIAEFTAAKEQEFVTFRQRLQEEDAHIDKDNLQIISSKNSLDETWEELRVNSEAKEVDKTIEIENGVETKSWGLLPSVNDLEPHLQRKISPGTPKTNGPGASSISDAFKEAAFHEREIEFRGLFTPSYLPLLDHSTYSQDSGVGRPHLKIRVKKEDQNASRQTAISTLAPSASLPASPISSTSPGSAPPLSASAPRERSSHLRRSSSRSDTSVASLRSSLRDPKHPRSPKRVLFSIDNLVVSPNTSPTARRAKNVPHVQHYGFDNVPQGFENIAAGTANKEPQSPDSWSDIALEKNRSNSAPTNGKLYMSQRFRRSLNLKSAASLNGEEAFKPAYIDDGKVDDDDLFRFDEDIGIGELEHAKKSSGDSGSDDDAESKNNEPVSSSPHAGSLPIEIKWPVRPDPRG